MCITRKDPDMHQHQQGKPDPDQHLNDADQQFWYLEITAYLFAEYRRKS